MTSGTSESGKSEWASDEGFALSGAGDRRDSKGLPGRKASDGTDSDTFGVMLDRPPFNWRVQTERNKCAPPR